MRKNKIKKIRTKKINPRQVALDPRHLDEYVGLYTFKWLGMCMSSLFSFHHLITHPPLPTLQQYDPCIRAYAKKSIQK